MSRFVIPEHVKQGPQIQLAPLIDIAFWALIVFMYIAAYSQLESDLDISVPKASIVSDAVRTQGEIIINITRDGSFVVNDQRLNAMKLEEMLKEVAGLFPNQQVIIRADEETYHKFVVSALDACARADIFNVSFATIQQGDKTP